MNATTLCPSHSKPVAGCCETRSAQELALVTPTKNIETLTVMLREVNSLLQKGQLFPDLSIHLEEQQKFRNSIREELKFNLLWKHKILNDMA